MVDAQETGRRRALMAEESRRIKEAITDIEDAHNKRVGDAVRQAVQEVRGDCGISVAEARDLLASVGPTEEQE